MLLKQTFIANTPLLASRLSTECHSFLQQSNLLLHVTRINVPQCDSLFTSLKQLTIKQLFSTNLNLGL